MGWLLCVLETGKSASKVPAARGLLGPESWFTVSFCCILMWQEEGALHGTSVIKPCTNPRQKALIPYPNDLTRVLPPRTPSHRKSAFQCRKFEETQAFIPEKNCLVKYCLEDGVIQNFYVLVLPF